jgi:hypothetical protein
MAGSRPVTIETEHFHAAYSHRERGHICLFICGHCGRRGDAVVRDFDGPPTAARAGLPEGWDAGKRGPRGEALPRCDTCIAGRADAVAGELPNIA